MREVRTKVIPEFPSYTVSDDGKVFNRHGRQLAGCRNGGYHQIKLRDVEGTPRSAMVHRLVVSAFIGPIPKGMWVNHKNGIKNDNRVENLEITTPQENMAHMFKVLKRSCANFGTANGSSKLTEDDVREIRRLVEAGEKHRVIAAKFGISDPVVSQIKLRRYWGHVQ